MRSGRSRGVMGPGAGPGGMERPAGWGVQGVTGRSGRAGGQGGLEVRKSGVFREVPGGQEGSGSARVNS